MLEKLTDREKFLIIGGVVFFVMLLFFFTLAKIIGIRTELSDEISSARTNSIKLDSMINKYNYFKSIKSADAEDKSVIYGKIDKILIRYSLKDRTQLNESETEIQKEFRKLTIESKMKSVKLNDVFKFMYDIEVNKELNSRIDYFTFTKVIGKEEYDTVMRISSYSRIKK